MNKGILKEGDKFPVVDKEDYGVKLSELGISKNQSSNWQRIADIPEESFYLISYQMCYVM